MLRTMDLVHSLIVARLILHWWTYALIAIAVVLLPFWRDESFLRRIRVARGVLRSESLLGGDRAAPGRRSDHVAIFGDADGYVADVHRDFAAFGVPQSLRQCPDVIVRKTQRLDLRELCVFGKSRQCHSQTFQRVVQCVHSVTLAVICLYPSISL